MFCGAGDKDVATLRMKRLSFVLLIMELTECLISKGI